MAKSNFPPGRLEEVPGEVVKETVKSLNDLYQMGKPKSDEEVKERIDKYFEFCENSSIRPGIESLALSLGVTRTTLFNWQRGDGCSRERQELIIKAKGFVSAFIEQVMLNNKVYPATGIFLLKNWCSYRDSVEIEPVQRNLNEPELSKQEIQDILARHPIGEPLKKPELPDIFDKTVPEILDELPE